MLLVDFWIQSWNSYFSYSINVLQSHLQVLLFLQLLIIIIMNVYSYYLEEQVMIFTIVFLNIYMVYRGVSYKYIGFGFLILIVLRACILKAGKETMDNENYEIYHPFCHYIGRIYMLYCVYFIQETFEKTESSIKYIHTNFVKICKSIIHTCNIISLIIFYIMSFKQFFYPIRYFWMSILRHAWK